MGTKIKQATDGKDGAELPGQNISLHLICRKIGLYLRLLRPFRFIVTLTFNPASIDIDIYIPSFLYAQFYLFARET